MKLHKVFNISATNSFADALAQKLLDEYADNRLELADILILLPNRRACKTLAEAFVRQGGNRPTLLPRLLPIGEIDDNDLMLSGIGSDAGIETVLPAIEPMQRLLLLMKLIAARPQVFGGGNVPLDQACMLAGDLGRLIDAAHYENLDFSRLADLVPEEYAEHWQKTLKFLEIITQNWPQILQEYGRTDLSARNQALILKQASLWRQNPPRRRVIMAGSTATYPAMRELAGAVASLPQGSVVLGGLDRNLDDESWAAVDETHPQFELKQLLEFLQLDRRQVQELIPPRNPAREKLISETMRPAATTDRWRKLRLSEADKAVEGLHIVNCRDIRQEALAIALIMRQTLETPEKTAALVTPDRNLARRTAAELERWNIKVDDSAGRPLVLTPWGIFMRLVCAAAAKDAKRTEILALLKNPLCGMGFDRAELRRLARKTERILWRGQRADEAGEQLLEELKRRLTPLSELLARPQADFKKLLQAHIAVAEAMAQTNIEDGAAVLWKGDAGAAGAGQTGQLLQYAETLGDIRSEDYPALFQVLMREVMVRPKYGTHPRLKILGPIEARLNHFDVMILGEVNEGVWPAGTAADPWLSRPMKREFGLPQPEKAIGIMGLDFASFMGAEEVYLTRADKVEGAPMIKSRWQMRLETVLTALDLTPEKTNSALIEHWAQHMDRPSVFAKSRPPAPTPPVYARPRELSATAMEHLMRDPYGVFAKYILKLEKLKDIEPELTMADFGNLLHKTLEAFNNMHPDEFPADAEEELLRLGRQKFEEDEALKDKKAFWLPKFEKMIEYLATLERTYRPQIRRIHNEIKGSYSFEAAAGNFAVTAKADRIDETIDGRINVIDYKTGRARSLKEVKSGLAPQLPIEALIAQKGGFAGVAPKPAGKLMYWQLGKGKEIKIDAADSNILEETEQHIRELVTRYDFATTPYLCRPNPKWQPEYSDYEHLERVSEWFVNEDGDD